MDKKSHGGYTMYAIAFDLDNSRLEQTYRNTSIPNAYKDIENVLLEYGFKRQQGSVYFGDETVNAVTCTTAVMELTQMYEWFAPSVRDIRMLRIEDNNDLSPVIESTVKLTKNRTEKSTTKKVSNY